MQIIQEEKKEEETLYDKFGGDIKMQTFINDLAEAWVNDAEIGPAHEKLKDPELMCLFKEKMFHFFKYKMDGLKYYIG